MSADTDIVEQYFHAWDNKDTSAILATFNDGGIYSDPAAGTGLQGKAIADYADSLFTAFPDIHLELVSHQVASNGMIVAPWILFGTHLGELAGHMPTSSKVELLGCDFIVCSRGKIDSVTGVFDPAQLMQQLGLSDK